MKYFHSIFLLFFCVSALFSQLDFEYHEITGADERTFRPTVIESVDLNGDGFNDIISASHGDNKLAWFENLGGTGKFGPINIISTKIDFASSIQVVDFDMDGDLDLVAPATTEDQIVWFENQDNLGNFSDEKIIGNQEGAYDVETADLDGDGDLDVLAGAGSARSLLWFENIGFDFVEHNLLTHPSQNAADAVHGDLDGDNDQDVIITLNGNRRIFIKRNLDGQGTFGGLEIMVQTEDPIKTVMVEDIDNDGDEDLICATSLFTSKIIWYENLDGLGNYSDVHEITSEVINPTSLHLADLDNDGDLDLLTASENDNKIVAYYNIDGAGSFGDQEIITEERRYAANISTSDINHDGALDIIAAFQESDVLGWFENLGGGLDFGPRQIINHGANYPYSSVLLDLDNDNDLDLVASSLSDGKLSWYENLDGQGSFGKQNQIIHDEGTTYKLATADVNGDGQLDLIAAMDVHKLGWFEKIDGPEPFAAPIIFSDDPAAPNDFIHVSELNDAGRFKIFTSNNYRDTIAVFRHLPSQNTFAPPLFIPTSFDGLHSVRTGDLDGDGDLDVFAGSRFSGRFAWFENINESETYGPQQLIGGFSNGANVIRPVDLDGDDDLDILTALVNGKITWRENLDGLGTLGDELEIEDRTNSFADLITTDVNNDGDLDIVIVSTRGLYWYDNIDGLGNFGPRQKFDIPSNSPQEINNGDIDNDGDMDFVITSKNDDRIIWVENRGVAANTIFGRVVLDIDDDGCDDEDILVESARITADNGNEPLSTTTGENGFFQLFPQLGEYNTFVSSSPYPNYTANPDEYNFVFNEIGIVEQADFCLEPDLVFNDLQINSFPLRVARPGFIASYKVEFSNVGTTVLDGTATFGFDAEKMNYLSSSVTVELENTNLVVHEYNALLPFETRSFVIFFRIKTPPEAMVGDRLGFIATGNPVSGDITPLDNTKEYRQEIVSHVNQSNIYFDFNTPLETNIATADFIEPSSINEPATFDVLIYPSPVREILQLRSKSQIKQIEIYDRMGRLLWLTNETKTIDLSSLHPGLYILRIKSLDGIIDTQKIIKI